MMNKKHTKAAILFDTNSTLQVKNIEIPILLEGQVLVKILFSGVCRSQLMEVRGARGEDPWLPHLLGHGLPFAVGIALGLKVQKKSNRVIVLVGDGECHEGTIWESALVAQSLGLDNLCCFIDYNGSADQILPHPNIAKQWEAFGWGIHEIDGHNPDEIRNELGDFYKRSEGVPTAIIANTVKGKGVSFLQKHGPWHYKVPDDKEYEAIKEELQS